MYLEFWEAATLVFGTLISVVGGLYVFRKPLDEWIKGRDEKLEVRRTLSENDKLTEQNKTDIETIKEAILAHEEWQETTNKRLIAGDNKFKKLDADMELLKNGQLDTKNTLDLISTQIGLVACLLTGDEKAKELVTAIGNEYKDREKTRIVGGGTK